MQRSWQRALIAVAAGLVLVLSACTSVGEDPTTTGVQNSTTTSTVGTTTTSTASTTTTSVAPTTLAPSTTTSTVVDETTTTVPEPIPVDGPIPGSVWLVVGVRYDDTLNVRSGPGTTSAVVGTLSPDESDVAALGDAAQVGSVIWWHVESGSLEGWVSSRYLAAEGATTDVTNEVIDLAGGEIPMADTMDELADLVLAVRGGLDTVVVGEASDDGMIGEIAIDVFTVDDDAIRGERLHIFGQKVDAGSPFGLYAVESTALCWRAGDAFGLCV